MSKEKPLIVGAGPVGLAAALFLAERGIGVRIIDAAPTPSPYSRALAVNPRTLELLEHTGVTEKMLQQGQRMTGGNVWQGGGCVAELDIGKLKHRYPFMLALSQAASEKLLTEALQAKDIVVGRGLKLVSLYQDQNNIQAEIEKPNGAREMYSPPWMLAADGAHSVVRHALRIDFPGDALTDDWYLKDVPLDASLPRDSSRAHFLDDGKFLVYIPVVEDVVSGGLKTLWRVIGNFPFSMEKDSILKSTGPAVWESKFHISHRVADTFVVGNIYLAGDAAHIHSPIGARGMNLGIEDAFVFAELMAKGKISKYAHLRREVDMKVVRNVELITNAIANADSSFLVFFRKHLLRYVLRIPPLRNRLLKTATGLDHEVEL